MLRGGDYEPNYTKQYRYLIKYEGQWFYRDLWTAKPDWSDGVTDVIWIKNDVTMIASWWLKRDGKRYIKRPSPMVTESEMVMLMLQVDHGLI